MTNDLYTAIFFLFVEGTELSFLLPIIKTTDDDNDDNSHDDCNAFDPINLGKGTLLTRIAFARNCLWGSADSLEYA